MTGERCQGILFVTSGTSEPRGHSTSRSDSDCCRDWGTHLDLERKPSGRMDQSSHLDSAL